MRNSLGISKSELSSEYLARRNARKSLLDFTLYTKPDYEVSWHHKVLCDALDRLVSGDIKRLMVSMPPRHGKSELVSRRLPAYILGRNPDANVIACSYSADLASAMNRDVQRIIDAPEYSNLFPETKLSGSNIRTTAQGGTSLRNSDVFEVVGHRGGYRSAGVGGGITGMGADFGIIDDPVKNHQEAQSPTYRAGVWEWYTTTLYTRLDEADSRILCTMTRWHEDDLAGRLIEAMKKEDGEQWEIISFPAVAEETRGLGDPREVGDALWPEKFPAGRLATIQTTIGPYPWGALYQQHPEPDGGGLFKRKNFRYFSIVNGTYVLHAPEGDKIYLASACPIFQTADSAGSMRNRADYTAVGTWATTPESDLLALDMFKERSEGPDLPNIIKSQRAKWDPVTIGIEPKNTGLTLYQQMKRDGLPVVELDADADKFTRALPVAARAAAGCIYHLVGASWLDDYESELVKFPGGAHDDQVDVTAYAYVLQQTITLCEEVCESPVVDDRSSIPNLGIDWDEGIPGF